MTTPENRAVLVTGAAGGIGTAVTRALADSGYRVYAGVRGAPGPADVPGVRPLPLDVTDPESVAAAAKEVSRAEGERGLYALVNNAGVIVQGPLELVPPEELHRQFAVNVYGPATVTREFLPLLRRGGGRIVNISAPTARCPVPFMGALSASKAALESLSHVSRMEFARWDIPVVIVVPGAVNTAIFDKSTEAARIATGRSDPERVALYRDQVAALERMLAGQRTAPARRVADVVARAVAARRPKARYTAGMDARLVGVLARLPLRLRDRVAMTAVGG
ncbi:SDR family NAD(P)-dependent oxidoreductase [Marinactinospora rubrisoli]|uniref:SDR family NAD(P)-dependent oxidoreductase n=1 Tax=Marinactinospora rubrisoli TaxID=2715399 RepID=A0ABW2KQ79_9ACTN